MRKGSIRNTGIMVLSALFLYACAGAGRQHYDTGMQLGDAGQYKEAIAYLEQAVAKEPKNEQYRRALHELKETLVNDFVTQGAQALGSESPLTIAAINAAKVKLAKAKEIDPDHSAVINFARTLEKQEDSLLSELKTLHSQAKQYIAAGEWLKAFFNLQQIQGKFPNYEDSSQLLTQTANKGSQALYAEAKSLFDKEDYKGATGYLHKALSLKGDHEPSRELLTLALERDNKDYFVGQGKKAAMAQEWKQATKAYERALEYDPKDQNLIELINAARNKTAQFFIREARTQMYAGWLLKAFETYELTSQYTASRDDPETGNLREDLCSQTKTLADQFKGQGQFGAAWFWYQKIKNIDPQYPEIFYLIQAMEDRITQRLRKSIAVFDFGSPSDSPDAGVIFANNLITFLFKTASNDVKILERENLKSILEEMKLGQIGVVSAQTAKEMGRVYGIDVAVMGSVLRYNVESSVYSDTKTVTYQVEKIVENIDYLNWKAKNPNPTREELDQAPVPFLRKKTDVEKEYKVSTHKKVAFVTVSFRIVDVNTGENILVDTIPRKKTAKDETSAGVQIAGIKFDPLEIPTDTELLQQLTNEVVAELGREGLRPLRNLEKTYFQTGEKHLQRRDYLQAVESFVDAVFAEKIKMIQGSPMTQKALQNIEDAFRNHKVKLEG
jgi:tetratricopeptide (TPR) repeat protein